MMSAIKAEVTVLTDSTYEEKLKAHKSVVLLFSASWCGACKDMKPVYENFALKNKDKTLFTEIDTDAEPKSTAKYNIESLPTLIVIENGKEVKRVSGSLETEELELFVYTKEVMAKYIAKCNSGESKACVELGELYEEGAVLKKDYAKALSFYEKSCNLKNAEGCMYLGYMYDEALGVKQDYSKAKQYYVQACKGENIIACRFLGYMYDEGLGMEKDYKKAHELYVKSCKGEDQYACYNLGYMYTEGNGVSKDLAKALSFYEQACSYDYDDACVEVKKLKK